jgi:hypothetical protein
MFSSSQLIKNEETFFQNGGYPLNITGTKTLKSKLMNVLESHMSNSIHTVIDAVQNELNDTKYF